MLIPDENKRDLKEIPDNIKGALIITPVKWIDEVLDVALQRKPEPLEENMESSGSASKDSDSGSESDENHRISAH